MDPGSRYGSSSESLAREPSATEHAVLLLCYSFEDPTSRLPEELGIALDEVGVRIVNPEMKQPVTGLWPWSRVLGFSFEADEDAMMVGVRPGRVEL